MKPRLIIGLGNTLAGDDGIGCQLVLRLSEDPRLPEDVDLLLGGADLSRHADAFEGRRQVLLLDAALDGRAAGTVTLHHRVAYTEPGHRQHAHHLSAIQALGVLQAVRGADFPEVTLMTISIPAVRIGPHLSSELARRVPELVGRVLHELGAGETKGGVMAF